MCLTFCLSILVKQTVIHVDKGGVKPDATRRLSACFGLCGLQTQAASFALASRFRLTPCSAACVASARWTSGGIRTLNWPL